MNEQTQQPEVTKPIPKFRTLSPMLYTRTVHSLRGLMAPNEPGKASVLQKTGGSGTCCPLSAEVWTLLYCRVGVTRDTQIFCPGWG